MKQKYGVALGAAVVSIFSIVIAYAAMSTTLNITVNKITQNPLTWGVAFVTGTLTPTTYGTGSDGRSCGNATATATAITVADTTLSKPDDGCRWTIQVNNSGGIGAKVGAITFTKPVSSCTTSGSTMVCGNVTYKITTDDAGSTALTTSNFSVGAGNTKTLYLFATYTGTSLNGTGSAITLSNAKVALRFDQN